MPSLVLEFLVQQNWEHGRKGLEGQWEEETCGPLVLGRSLAGGEGGVGWGWRWRLVALGNET